MTVFTPRSQQSKEKTAKICDYLPFSTMRLDRVAQVLSPATSLSEREVLDTRWLAIPSLRSLHSDQKSVRVVQILTDFSLFISQNLLKSRVFATNKMGLFFPALRVEQAHFSHLTTCLTTCGDFGGIFGCFLAK